MNDATRSYLSNLGTCTSQVCNTVIGGNPDVSLSARAFLSAQRSARAATIERLINGLFFFEPDHCRRSFERDVSHARETLEQHDALSKDHSR